MLRRFIVTVATGVALALVLPVSSGNGVKPQGVLQEASSSTDLRDKIPNFALPAGAAPSNPASASKSSSQTLVKPADSDRKWAFVVGVGKFTGRTKPNPGSAGDAFDVRQLLMSQGWRDDHIRILTDSAATGPRIREGLQWLAQQCKAGSACVFHYSGHVKQLKANDGDAESVDEALWSHENQFIADGEVARYLRQLPNAWINISGCEAAGFNDNLAGPRRLFTASSKETEKSYEHPDWKNSIWTGLLVDQGIMGGQADTNNDGKVTRTEAFAFAVGRAAYLTSEQSKGPQHPQIAGGEAVDWLVPVTATAPRSPFRGPCVFGLPCYGWTPAILQ